MQSAAIGVNDVESAAGAVPAVVAPLEEDEALAVRRPRGDLRVATPRPEPDESAQVPSVRVRDDELVPVDPLRGIHRGPLRPKRTGKALEGDVLPVGRPDGPPVVGLAFGDPDAMWAVRGQPPKPGSVGLDDPDRVHARGRGAGEDDARSVGRPVRVGVLGARRRVCELAHARPVRAHDEELTPGRVLEAQALEDDAAVRTGRRRLRRGRGGGDDRRDNDEEDVEASHRDSFHGCGCQSGRASPEVAAVRSSDCDHVAAVRVHDVEAVPARDREPPAVRRPRGNRVGRTDAAAPPACRIRRDVAPVRSDETRSGSLPLRPGAGGSRVRDRRAVRRPVRRRSGSCNELPVRAVEVDGVDRRANPRVGRDAAGAAADVHAGRRLGREGDAPSVRRPRRPVGARRAGAQESSPAAVGTDGVDVAGARIREQGPVR